MDCDHPGSSCEVEQAELKRILQQSMEAETELLRTYTMTSERIHGNEELRVRLQNFAEGNAKRSKQLLDELNHL